MTVAQSIATKGARQNAQARNLINNVQASPMSMEQTVEKYSDQDVIVEGVITLVRSKFSAHRYFMVNDDLCSCEKRNCAHIAKANAFKAAQVKVEEVKPPTPSQAKKMVVATFATKVLALKANKDLTVAGVSIVSGEKFYLVAADRFPGYAYVVTFNNDRAKYVCSCGNPGCTAHTVPAMRYAALHAGKVVAAPARKDIRGSVEWYADQHQQYEDARKAVRDEKALVAAIKSEFASVVVDVLVAKINDQFGRVVVRRGIVALSQKEAA